jgi:DNA-directed RNA polymerase subunit RPC12/RpoP
MYMRVTCPICGHAFRVLERVLGQQVTCPACSKAFQCGSLSPPSLDTRPLPDGPAPGDDEGEEWFDGINPTLGTRVEQPSLVHPMPVARPVLVLPTQSIHYRCPRCTKPLESPAHMAGQKLNCPDCGQRLKIPQASAPPSPTPENKTILATEDKQAGAASQVPSPVPPLPPTAPPSKPLAQNSNDVILEVIPAHSPATPATTPREYCLECGANISNRPRVQTCPDCGSLFCSAMCYREHRYQAHSSRRR